MTDTVWVPYFQVGFGLSILTRSKPTNPLSHNFLMVHKNSNYLYSNLVSSSRNPKNWSVQKLILTSIRQDRSVFFRPHPSYPWISMGYRRLFVKNYFQCFHSKWPMIKPTQIQPTIQMNRPMLYCKKAVTLHPQIRWREPPLWYT